jgi:hypothetical protein
VHLRARGEAGDISVEWVRAARFGGDSWAGVEVPMAEETEAYRVRILSGGTLLRQVEVAAPGFLYTAAMQAEDGAGAVLEIRIAQLSMAFGYGLEGVLITDG